MGEAADLNADGWLDLIGVGEWMPVSVWINEKGILKNKTQDYRLQNTTGLWTSLLVEDLNEDGKPDILAGNMGKNTFFKPGMKLYLNDFDANGSLEPIICYEEDGKDYPIADKDELIAQLPYLKKRALKYATYAKASMSDLFSKEQRLGSTQSKLQQLETTLFLSSDKGYESHPLPPEIQYAPVYAVTHHREEKKNKGKLFFGGNQFLVKPQFGRYDASQGWELSYIQTGLNLKWETPKSLGVKGQLRQLEIVPLKSQKKLLLGLNNNALMMKSLVVEK